MKLRTIFVALLVAGLVVPSALADKGPNGKDSRGGGRAPGKAERADATATTTAATTTAATTTAATTTAATTAAPSARKSKGKDGESEQGGGKGKAGKTDAGEDENEDEGKGKGRAAKDGAGALASTCSRESAVVLIGRFAAVDGNGFAMLVSGGNRAAARLKGRQVTLQADDRTRYTRRGRAELVDFQRGDRLEVAGRICKQAAADQPVIVAARVVGQPAKGGEKGRTTDPVTTTSPAGTSTAPAKPTTTAATTTAG